MSILNLNEKQNAILGGIGSLAETTIQYPLNIIKNKLQYNSKIHINFSFLYKGFIINSSTLAFITSFQFYGYKYIYHFTNNDFSSSFLSGILSAFICSPTELFIIQKFKYRNFLTMHSSLIQEHGLFKFYYRGLLHCMMRESIYTVGMLSLTPYIEKKLEINGLYASVISGIISGTISHPFDTMKTVRQFDFYKVEYKNLFNGYIPRIWRIIGTYFIINQSNKYFYDFVKTNF